MRNWKLLVLAAALAPGLANAWWNPEWTQRKKITFNPAQAGVSASPESLQSPVLVRLHTGNFNFMGNVKLDGSDLRFVGGDDKTPLKYHIEKFDPVNEMALVWVTVPTMGSTPENNFIWVYSGNATVSSGESSAESYGVSHAAVYHFGESDAMPRDYTANKNNVAEFTATLNRGSLIGAGASFAGAQKMVIPASPSIKVSPTTGTTISAWIKVAGPQAAPASVLELAAAPSAASSAVAPVAAAPAPAAAAPALPTASSFGLWIDQTNVYVKINQAGVISEMPHTAALTPNAWHFVTVTVSQQVKLYVDGQEAGVVAAPTTDITGALYAGSDSSGASFFTGDIDEVKIQNVAIGLPAIQFAAKTEGQDAGLLTYGQDETPDSEGGGSYFGVILKSVTLDGWVVIGILMVMAVISWLVMVTKSLLIVRTARDNREFLESFSNLSAANPAELDDQYKADAHGDDSVLTSLFGAHEKFQDSGLYRIYHAGVQEVKHRLGNPRDLVNVGRQALSPQALQVVRASLDAAAVRETQRLNNMMVLLTIAISGGPFLGLLGTVVGVMITFAAIAASGDVNVNAIAPGIAAALVATVAGLAVAIPALFGYNYFTIRIKDLSADMHVFVDELISKLAERYAI